MKRLVRIVALALVVLACLGFLWSLWPYIKPPPDWAALRQRARTYLMQAEGYSTVATYFDEHFDGAADLAQQDISGWDPREKVDLSAYVTAIELQFVELAKKENRVDVMEYIRTIKHPPHD